jgi:hypothetical protein
MYVIVNKKGKEILKSENKKSLVRLKSKFYKDCKIKECLK